MEVSPIGPPLLVKPPLNSPNGYNFGSPLYKKSPPPQDSNTNVSLIFTHLLLTPSNLRPDPRKAMKFEAEILSTGPFSSASSPSPLKKTTPGTRTSKYGAENADPNLPPPADPTVPLPAAKPDLQEPDMRSEAPASGPCVKVRLGMIGSLLQFFFIWIF